jgi:hypothetical protein
MVEFTLQSGRLTLYITGDTLVFEDIKQIPRRYPQIDLGLLHLGGTRVLGIFVTNFGNNGCRAGRGHASADRAPGRDSDSL